LQTPEDTVRVPARISSAMHDKLRELCFIKLKRPLEVVIGEWIEDRLTQELHPERRQSRHPKDR